MITKNTDNQHEDRLILDVGGTIFVTSRLNVMQQSAYFRELLDYDGIQAQRPVIFVDHDPDVFQILLSYMRYGSVSALSIGSGSSKCFDKLVLQAKFFGMDKFLQILLKREQCQSNLNRNQFQYQYQCTTKDGDESYETGTVVITLMLDRKNEASLEVSIQVHRNKFSDIMVGNECEDANSYHFPVKSLSEALTWVHAMGYTILRNMNKSVALDGVLWGRLIFTRGFIRDHPMHWINTGFRKEFGSITKYKQSNGTNHLSSSQCIPQEINIVRTLRDSFASVCFVDEITKHTFVQKINNGFKESYESLLWLDKEQYMKSEADIEEFYSDFCSAAIEVKFYSKTVPAWCISKSLC